MPAPGLDHWYCDVCDEPITDPAGGTVISRSARDAGGYYVEHDFLIVHKGRRDRGGCDPGSQSGYVNSVDLGTYLGISGQTWLLALLSAGPLIGGPSRARVRDLNEFVDLFRRLQAPHYEEARRRFADPQVQDRFSGANEVFPYMPDILAQIAHDQPGT